MADFTFPVRVYYEDTDAEGVVYHASYLRFMERARTEWCRHLGLEVSTLADKGVILIVKNIWLDYLQPARLDDALVVETTVEEIRKVKIVFQQTIRAADDPQVIYCKGLVTVVCVNKNLKPCKLLPEIVEKMTSGD